MLKKLSKFLILVLLVFVVSSSSLICLADEEHNHEEIDTSDEITSTTPEIYTGDLYLLGNEVVMDKYVDGNVFIIGNKVKISGQINGSLYVLANQINFDTSLIRYSIFACANYVYYNNTGTYENNVYIAANKLETTFSSYAARDFKIICSDLTFKSGVGRDADLICNTLDLGEGEDIPEIYGDLRYTANKEITIPENAVIGSTTYTKQLYGNSLIGILISFGTCIVTALAVSIILNKFNPKFVAKISNEKLSVLKIVKAFGIGLATIAIVSILVVLLATTTVGTFLAVILALLSVILYIIAVPTLVIKITNTLKPALKLEKASMFYLVIALVSIILHGITLIPYVGTLLGLIINIIALGLIVNVFLPHKELSEEEKLALEETKKIAKENKEKRKQEKLEVKAEKKANKNDKQI